jgi:hypothetical protein
MGVLNWLFGTTPSGVVAEGTHAAITGVFEGVKDLIEEFHLPPEQEAQAKLRLSELHLQTYQAQITDVQSARQMQMSNKSPWPGILTLVIVGGFYGVLGVIFFKGLPSTSAPGGEIVLLLIGSLSTALTAVLGYWFGTTQSSQQKDKMLMESVPASAIQPKP